MASSSSESQRHLLSLASLLPAAVCLLLSAGLSLPVSPLPQAQSPATAAAYDPLQLFVGTWVSRGPSGEKTIDCVSLKLTESGGQLTGTLSHFGLSLFADGQDLPSPCAPGEDAVKNLRFDDGFGDFQIGDNLEDVRVTPEGTDVIVLTFGGPTAASTDATRQQQLQARKDEELKFMNQWHAWSFSPDTFMVRARDHAGAAADSGQEETIGSSVASDQALWPAQYALVIVNTAESRYRFKHGTYADYAEIANSGLLENTADTAFKGSLGLDFRSPVTPRKGWKVVLSLAPDRLAYSASIILEQKKCEVRFTSHQTGMIAEERLPGCS